jgi:hypothetical protein
MRHHLNQSKLVVFKIVKTLVNKKMFIFYSKARNFNHLLNNLVETFSFVGFRQQRNLLPVAKGFNRRLSRSMSKVWKN